MEVVGAYLTTAKVVFSTPVSLLGGPAFIGTMFGMSPLGEVLVQWAPILYVSLLPVFSVLLYMLGCSCTSGERDLKFGARTAMRRVMIAVRAETRMNQSTKYTKLLEATGYKYTKGKASYMQPTASALESGMVKGSKSPDQTKAKKEEAAIKSGAKKGKK